MAKTLKVTGLKREALGLRKCTIFVFFMSSTEKEDLIGDYRELHLQLQMDAAAPNTR